MASFKQLLKGLRQRSALSTAIQRLKAQRRGNGSEICLCLFANHQGLYKQVFALRGG